MSPPLVAAILFLLLHCCADVAGAGDKPNEVLRAGKSKSHFFVKNSIVFNSIAKPP